MKKQLAAFQRSNSERSGKINIFNEKQKRKKHKRKMHENACSIFAQYTIYGQGKERHKQAKKKEEDRETGKLSDGQVLILDLTVHFQ